MKYKNEGHTISVPFNKDYSIIAVIRSNSRSINSYVVTLLLADHSNDFSWKIEENIKVEADSKLIYLHVTDNIIKLIQYGYFNKYVNKWEYWQNAMTIGLESLEKK